MPGPRSSASAAPAWLIRLVYAFAGASAVLWIIGFFEPYHFLFPPGPDFEDILVYKGRFTLYHSIKFFKSHAFSGFAYPAGAAPIYEAFYKTADPVQTYLILAAVIAIAALLAAFLFLRRNNAARLFPALLLLSFPFVFLVQRANIELILWLLVALGLVAALRGLRVAAAILFGVAAAIKLYPILLLGLFLRRKDDLPAFFTGLVTALLAMAAAIAYTGPTFTLAAQGFFTGIDRFQGHYVDTISRVEVLFDHCLFSPFKYYAAMHHQSLDTWRVPYYCIAGTLALLLFLRVRTLPFLNRAVFLTVAMVALPPVSFVYTLNHLYMPFVFLLATFAGTRSTPPASARLTFVLLLLVLTPMDALTAFGALPVGPLQAVLLLCVLLLATTQPWPGPRAAIVLD
jgi:hypothetical protein